MIWFILFTIIVLVWSITRFYLRGADLSQFDHPRTQVNGTFNQASDAHYKAVQQINDFAAPNPQRDKLSRKKQLYWFRDYMDTMGESADLTDIELRPADVNGIKAEWVLAKGADPDRRLLYLHGGAFTMGSPKSHRPITTKLSRITGASVLVLDYRLMPENHRLEGIADCCSAYQWILNNGPSGPAKHNALFVAGDSAGGSLTLVTIAWARDMKLPAADAAIAISPSTDMTMSNPSLLSNLETDHMLGPIFGKLMRLPKGLLLWYSWLSSRVRPCDPRVSPVYGDLSNLPPTLIHASEVEMVLDDSVRYAAKAGAAGSNVQLKTWHDMLHAWHIFEPSMPEAKQAFDDIAEFIENIKPRENRESDLNRKLESRIS